MRANSFVHWTREAYGRAAANDIQIHKCLENTHPLYKFGVGLYNRIQRHAPWAHHVYFNFLEVAGLHYSSKRLLGTDRFRAILDHVRPRVILSTHGSLNHGFFDLARQHMGRDNVRCVTYCGELFGKYGFSRHWVNPDADLFVGAVPETVAMARRLGMPADKAMVGGFLLNPSFYRPPLTSEERATFMQQLDLDPERFTLLLSTGEHGANNHLAFLEAMRKRKPRRDLQVIALCGHDPKSWRLCVRRCSTAVRRRIPPTFCGWWVLAPPRCRPSQPGWKPRLGRRPRRLCNCTTKPRSVRPSGPAST